MPKKQIAFLFIVFICILFGFTSKLIVHPDNYPNSDFFSFWLSGRMLSSGQDPYEAEGWVGAHYKYGAEWISDRTFLYPLPLAILFVPFGLLPLYIAFLAWVWLSLILLWTSVALLLSSFGVNWKHYVTPIVLGILLYRPTIPLLVNGQLSAIFLSVIVGSGVLWERGRWLWGGVLLSILFLKPNIGVPILALVVLYLLVYKSYGGLLGIVLGGAGILITGLLFDSAWIGKYLDVLQGKQLETFGYSVTLWGLFALAVDFHRNLTFLLGVFFTLLGCSSYLIKIVKTRLAPLQGLALAVTIALLITPYLWPYDQVLLILPIVISMLAMKNRRLPYLVGALSFILLDIFGWLLFGWSLRLQMENPNSLLTLLVLVLLLLALRPPDMKRHGVSGDRLEA